MKKLLTLCTVCVLGACSSTSDNAFSSSVNSDSGVESASFGRTFIKHKIENFKSETNQVKELVDSRKQTLQSMRNNTNTSVSDYRNTLSQINAKLQMGTTPGNPDLMNDWKTARAKLEKVNNLAFDIKRLVADIESDQSMVEYMLDSIKASYKVRGATEEDHKQLKSLETEVKQIGSGISMFAQQVNAEADRQLSYVENEKQNLNDVALNIKNGGLYGNNNSTSMDFFSNGGSVFSSEEGYNSFIAETEEQDYGYQTRASGKKKSMNNAINLKKSNSMNEKFVKSSDVKQVSLSKRKILSTAVESANLASDFDEVLYRVLSKSLERNPSAVYEVVGVAKNQKSVDKVKKYLNNVVKSFVDMGVPASRVSMTMKTDNVDTDEVNVYEK